MARSLREISPYSICVAKGGSVARGMTANVPPYTEQFYCQIGKDLYDQQQLYALFFGTTYAENEAKRLACEARGGQWVVYTGGGPGSGECQRRPDVLPSDAESQCVSAGGSWSIPSDMYPNGICRSTGEVTPPTDRASQCAAAGGTWSPPSGMYPEGICRGERAVEDTAKQNCLSRGFQWDELKQACYAVAGAFTSVKPGFVPPPPVRPPVFQTQTPMSSLELQRHNLIALGLRSKVLSAKECGTPAPVAGTSPYRNCGFYRVQRVQGTLRLAAPRMDFERAVAYIRTIIWQQKSQQRM